jgi:hypothetical protein
MPNPVTPTTEAREIERLRALNSSLNRRCQQAEAAARHNVEECRRQGVPLGRYLANWAARDYMRQLEEARTEVAEAERRGAAREREACIEDASNERLTGETGEESDLAYNQAIDDVVKAIRARSLTSNTETGTADEGKGPQG